jgi:LuxR family quorum sensing-dependent transcriptional regulator
MLDTLSALSEGVLRAGDPLHATGAFHAAVSALGASYLQTRVYRRPVAPLTSATHWAAGGFVARYAVKDWVGSDGFNYICFDCNPLIEPIRRGHTRYRFSDFAPHADRRYGAYWEALSQARIGDALCSTAYGPGRRIASMHLGFERRDIAAETAQALQLAGMVLVERLITFEDAAAPPAEPALTPRERDAILFVAEGKTDWEIAAILTVSEATARFHVDNARRKLGAVNRAHAVARFLALSGPV